MDYHPVAVTADVKWPASCPHLQAAHAPGLKQEKDKRECPKCKSKNVRTNLEMVGETCPKCKQGVIREIWTGGTS